MILALVALAGSLHAQATGCEDGWCWGDDPGTAKEKYAFVSDAIRIDHYENNLIAPMEWLLEKTPQLNKTLYQHAEKIYQKLLAAEEDEAQQKKIQTRLLELYDLRAKYFGEEAFVLQRKGYYAYSYLIKDKKYDELYELYKNIFELNGPETAIGNLNILMLMSTIQFKSKKLDEDGLLDAFDKITDVVDINKAKVSDNDKDRWEDLQKKLEQLLTSTIDIDCEYVRKRMGDTIKNNPDDVKTAKKAISYMMNGKCTDDPLFMTAAANLFKHEPALGLAKVIYKKHLADRNYDQAMEWMQKAIGLASEDPKEKGDIFMGMAQISQVKGNKQMARNHALDAAKTDAAMTYEAFSLIGNLYMGSGSDCKDSDPVKSRACYLAAYDMFQKAGNNDGMNRAKEQFPSIQEIFSLNLTEGSTIDVGCWIGGTTTIRRR